MERRCDRREGGFTVVELLFVGTLILIVFMLVFTSAAAMMRSGRVSNSTQRLVSTLNLARNLAITHNAIYHVRIQNYSCYPVESPVGSGTFKDVEIFEQAVSIHCFANTEEALKVLGIVRDPAILQNIGHPEDNKWSSSGLLGANTNYMLDRTKMDPSVYIGIQYNPALLAGVVPTKDAALYFLPDGTASETMTLFVTDNRVLQDNPRASGADWLETNAARYSIFNGTKDLPSKYKDRAGFSPQVEMVQVYRGGMIRALRQERTP